MNLKRLHHGWVIVIASMFATSVFSMVNNTFGIFLRPITIDFGWERGLLSAAQSIMVVVSGGLGILTGKLTDKYGPRSLVTLNGILIGISFLLMSRVSTLWHVYLIWGLLVGTAMSCLMVPITSTVPRWFIKKRGLAMGLTLSGASLGGIIWPPFTQWLISSYSWQRAYVTLSIISFIIVIFSAQLIKHSPQRVGLKPYGYDDTEKMQLPATRGGLFFKQAIRTGRFWVFCLILVLSHLSIQVITVHVVPHAVDIGISAMLAAGILSTVSGSNIAGKIIIGLTADRIGSRLALTLCLIILSFTLTWLIFASDTWMFYVFALVVGIAYGGTVTLSSLVLVDLFGLRYLGVMAGASMFIGSLGSAIGAPLAGAVFDTTGSYRIAFFICLICCVLAIALSLKLIRSPSFDENLIHE